MAYIGIDPNVGDITFQKFTGDGSATAFTLAQNVASGEAIVVTIGNVVQEPGSSAAYTAYGNTLTFSAAPANGDIITVRYFGRAVDQPLSYAMQLFKFVATASQTVFTGADNAGAILAFSGNDVDVYLNGVHLDTTDYTPTSGTTITLASGAALNDELVIRAYRAFSVTDTVSASSGGTFNGAVTFDAGANFGDNDKAIFGTGNDLQIHHDGSNSYITDAGTGNLYLRATNALIIQSADGLETLASFHDDNLCRLYYDNAIKLATTATGVDVTGTALAHTVEIGDGSAGGTSEVVFSDNVSGRAKILYDHGASPNEEMGFEIAGTRYMTIENGGNVGIGGSPNAILDVQAGAGADVAKIRSGSTNGTYFWQFGRNNSNGFFELGQAQGGAVTNNLVVDTAGRTYASNEGNFSDTNNANLCVNHSVSTRGINLHTTGTGGSDRITFQNDNGTVGTINTTGSSTSYGTSSDYRLKTAVEYDWDATSRLKQLKPARFEWIVDGDDAVPVDGFLAHEVQDIVPEAITGTKDAVDEDGNPVMQGIDQSKLVPLLCKTILELEARITALETN